jgi:hypothetical protein
MGRSNSKILHMLQKYRRKKRTLVVAVQLALTTSGFSYKKWGGIQCCKRGDWLVDNGTDVYTIDKKTFSQTYRRRSRGLYEKMAPVWAKKADEKGKLKTKEGASHYRVGDYLVFNGPRGKDGYAMSAKTFHSLYEK